MPAARAAPSRPLWPWLLAPLLLAALAYARVLPGEFQLDDAHAIVENARVKAGPAAFLEPGAWRPEGRPLTDLSFALNYAAGRLDPAGYHAVNLALHLAAAVLLFLLARRLLRRAGAAWAEGTALCAAGLFAVHPLASQAVSYVVQRAEVLCALLSFAALLLLLEAEERPGWRRAAAPALGGALAFGLALCAKQVAVAVPLAFLAAVLAAPRPGPPPTVPAGGPRAPDGGGAPPATGAPGPGRALLLAAPLALLAALFAAGLLRDVEGHADAGFSAEGLTPGRYLLTQARVLPTYLRLLLWPAGQSVDWDVPISTGLGLAEAAGGLVVLALVGGAVALAARARGRGGEAAGAARAAAAGLLVAFLFLAPTSTVVPVADVLVEHRTYPALGGLLLAACAAAALGLRRLRVPGPAALAGAALLALALAAALHARNAVWETRLALWTDAAAKAPGKARPAMNLGDALASAGRHEEALPAYRRALALLPAGPGAARAGVVRNLSAALLELGRPAEAAAALEAALRDEPRDPELLANLAECALELGEAARAEALARRAIALSPAEGSALNVLGQVRFLAGDAAGALAAFEAAVAADPDVPSRHFNVATAQDRLGRRAEACEALGRARAAARGRKEPVPEPVPRMAAALGCGG